MAASVSTKTDWSQGDLPIIWPGRRPLRSIRIDRSCKAPLEQVDPDGKQGLRHRCRLSHPQDFGHWQTGPRRRDAIVGIAAASDQRADAIADQLRRRPARSNDGASDLQSRNVARARRRRVNPLTLEDIGPVDACRGDLDQHLALARTRRRPRGETKLLGPAGRGNLHRPHYIRNYLAHAHSPRNRGKLIDLGPVRVNAGVMDEDDFFSSRPQDPLTLLVKQDLGPLSVDELNERIEALKAEIARVEQHLADTATPSQRRR